MIVLCTQRCWDAASRQADITPRPGKPFCFRVRFHKHLLITFARWALSHVMCWLM